MPEMPTRPSFIKKIRRSVIDDRLFKKIIKNAGIILGGNTTAAALGFISFAIMANALGPTLLAHFALAQIYAGIINNIFNVQTWESMIKFGTKNDKKNLDSTIKTNVVIDLISALIAFLFAITLLPYIARLLAWPEELIRLALLYSLTIPLTLTTLTIGIPRLHNRFFDITKIQFAAALLKLTIVASLSFIGGSAESYTLAYVITEIAFCLAMIIFSLRILYKEHSKQWIFAKIQLTREQVKFLWWTNLRTIVRVPVRQLDMIIISQVMNFNATGMYKAYKEIASIIDRLGEPINQAVFPEYAKLLGDEKTASTVTITRKIILLLSFISILTFIFFMLFSELIIGKIFGEEYLALIAAFYFLLVLTCINLALTPINSLFLAAGFARYGFYIVLFNNLLYLLIAIIGGMHFGIYGVILAFAVQMLFNQGAKLLLLLRHSTGWGSVIR